MKDNNKPFILVIGDSHGVDIFNSISTLSSYDFLIGLNRGACRPGDEKICQYKGALKFVEKN